MVFDPGVRQARIDLTPTRKSDRRVKKHELALFRLQQYNRFLHVCLCPIAVCSLLLLLYLTVEKHTKQTNSKICSKSRTNLCTRDSQARRATLTIKKVCANALISRRQCHVRRVVMKCTIQMLLLRAGDVEPNPGPTKALTIKNLINELSIIVHKWFEIGIQLGIEPSILTSFELQHNKDPRRCLSETLQYWIDGKACERSRVNWETIIEALESPSINEGAFASRLRENTQLQYNYGSGSASTSASGVSHMQLRRAHEPGFSAVTDSNFVHQSLTPQEPEFLCLVHKLKGLRIDHRTELQSRLLYESNEMIKKFNRFIISVRKSFDKRKVSLELVTEVLMGFGTFKCVSRHAKTSVFEEDFEDLKAAESMMKIMAIVRRYCNFFSYDIVEELVTALGDEEDKMNLSTYIEEFNEYAKRKVYECPTELSPVTESGQAIIYVTLDESYEDCTLSHLRLLQQKLCQILKISNKNVLRLCRIEPGSIKLVFSSPKLLLREISPLSFEQKERLTALKVTKIKFGHNQFCLNTWSLPQRHAVSTLKPVLETQDTHQIRVARQFHGSGYSSTAYSTYYYCGRSTQGFRQRLYAPVTANECHDQIGQVNSDDDTASIATVDSGYSSTASSVSSGSSTRVTIRDLVSNRVTRYGLPQMTERGMLSDTRASLIKVRKSQQSIGIVPQVHSDTDDTASICTVDSGYSSTASSVCSGSSSSRVAGRDPQGLQQLVSERSTSTGIQQVCNVIPRPPQIPALGKFSSTRASLTQEMKLPQSTGTNTYSVCSGSSTQIARRDLQPLVSVRATAVGTETTQVPRTLGSVVSPLVTVRRSPSDIRASLMPAQSPTDSSQIRPYTFQRTKDTSRMIESSQDREQNSVQVSSTSTPEIPQQDERMRGRYYCENCRRRWRSTYAWQGKWQKCRDCEAKIYPTSLKPFKTLGKKRPPTHNMHLCQKCIEQGHGCWRA